MLFPELDDMASQFSTEAERAALAQMANAGFSPSGLERFKLDRLRELRAVIATLRMEGEQTLLTPTTSSGASRFSHAQ